MKLLLALITLSTIAVVLAAADEAPGVTYVEHQKVTEALRADATITAHL